MSSNHKQINLAPYSRAALTTPLFHFIVEPSSPAFQQVLGAIYFLRWQLSRPFQIKLLPKWFPRLPFPGLTHVTYLTYGEVLLALPLLFLVVAGYYFIFRAPDVELSGNISSYGIIIGFLTANKSSSIFSFVLGIPFERLLGYHKLSAVVALAIAAAHVWVAFQDDHRNADLAQFAVRDVNNTLGTIIFFCLSGILMTSLFPILRRWNFDVWFCIHIGLAVTIAIPWACHSVNLVWLPLYWFVLDVIVRYVVMTGGRYASTATLRKLQTDVVEVRFQKPGGFHFNPGQFVRIAVPKLTAFQFHPFSVSSAPHDKFVTLHVRALGNWSKKLLQMAETGGDDVKIWMEGPYGAISVDLDHPRYGMVLCVCGGIGMTFCRSVIRTMLHDLKQPHIEKVRVVWACKDRRLVDNITPFREETEKHDTGLDQPEPTSPSWIQTDLYLTTMKSLDEEESFNDGDVNEQLVTHKGRPNLDVILSQVKEEAMQNGISHIAVLGCGPRGLVEALQEACRAKSNSLMECCPGVYFDLHTEIFEF
jgi:NADPH oxidase